MMRLLQRPSAYALGFSLATSLGSLTALAADAPAKAAPVKAAPVSAAPAKEAPVAKEAPASAAKLEEVVAKGVNFLKSKGQKEDGSFSSQTGIGVTALATTALLRSGRSAADPSVAKALAFLEKHVQADGGVYVDESDYRNYETSCAVLAFVEANQDGKYSKLIKKADAFLKGSQWDESEDKDPSDPFFGGAGYGKKKRPDLSNTSFLIDALKATGNGPDDEAMKRALIFISRCQNLETEHNTTPFAAKNPDGGFYYTPAAGGQSMSTDPPLENGGLRSYASMTYAGLKSMIYAGVKADDPRVKAAIAWLAKNYDLKNNPGLKDNGLYYYYHTFAKALHAMGQDEFVDKDGVKHNWRAELTAELARRQQADGGWINENNRWLEGDANLVTSYALLALSYCKK